MTAARTCMLCVLLALPSAAHAEVEEAACDATSDDPACLANMDDDPVNLLQKAVHLHSRVAEPPKQRRTASGAYSYGPLRAPPALKYFRHWARGKVASGISRELVVEAHVRTDEALVQLETAMTATAADALLSRFRKHNCPETEGRSVATWAVHDRDEDAEGVQHAVLRSREGVIQYLATRRGRVLAADPPACRGPSLLAKKAASKAAGKDKEKGMNATEPEVKVSGEPKPLDKESDPLVKDCEKLFHRTAKDVCHKDFKMEVLSAVVVVIDGLATQLFVKLTGPNGTETLHEPRCLFQVSTNHTDATLLQLSPVVEQDIANLQPTDLEKRGLHATLELTVPLCSADDHSDAGVDEDSATNLLQRGMGELSLYKGFEHVNDRLPRIHVPRRADAPMNFDMRTEYPACFPDQDGKEVVRNQGKCGSCWAFATSSATMNNLCVSGVGLEALANPQDRYEVSVQQILSCNSDKSGCEGGCAASADQAMRRNGGIAMERYFPYKCGAGDPHKHFEEASATCGAFPWGRACQERSAEASWMWGGASVVSGEDAMKSLISNSQSLYVSFKVSQKFMNHKDGVYTGPDGTNIVGGHAVVAMGYGVEDGTNYWLLQNSWGVAGWGVNGFGKFLRGYDLHGIETNAYILRAWVDGGEVPPCKDGQSSGLNGANGGPPILCGEAKTGSYGDLCAQNPDIVGPNCPITCGVCPAVGPSGYGK